LDELEEKRAKPKTREAAGSSFEKGSATKSGRGKVPFSKGGKGGG